MVQTLYRCVKAVWQTAIFGNFYIATCAVVMSLTTIRLFAFHVPASLLYFVFVGTLCSYSLHVYVTDWSLTNQSFANTERVCWITTHKQELLGVILGSLVIGIWYLAQLTAYLSQLLPVVLLTFLYTAPKIPWRPFLALRKIAVLKTLYLALVWTYVTVALPFLVDTSPQPARVLAGVWFINRFLLIYGIAMCFDYRDRDIDRQSKWLTLVSMLAEDQVRFLFRCISIGFALSTVGLYGLGFDLWQLLWISMPMILLVLFWRSIVSSSSDYTYYVILDGLLLVTGVLIFQ
ncbi:UbiA prenyltransferase family protein [Spirosoma aerophilum]